MRVPRQNQHSDCPAGRIFYLCSSPAFRGCCSVDPCQLKGCPDTNANILPISSNRSPTSTTSSANPTSVETLASVQGDNTVYITIYHGPTSTAITDSVVKNNSNGNDSARIGAIIGGVLGGIAVLIAAIVLLLYLRKKKLDKERRRATLPPPYAAADMSEQLCGGATTTISSSASSGATEFETSEKTRLRNAERTEREHEPVPQLDSTMIRPVNEIGGDALGIIPELPAVDQDPSDATETRAEAVPQSRSRRNEGADNHVMSWAQFNSMGTRDETSRLSHPHSAPDTSAAVWENMSPTSEDKPRF